ncbi:hypothetical protein Tcan_02516 [Toxocara canis]|uniref:Uncharacterized protein n=1 Tax=Toxocara canis TaxID=6265 RepID=A0A0B2UNY5_TOXCA|nr:hypothetical protein Tcan_02516 [Toxocara canis]
MELESGSVMKRKRLDDEQWKSGDGIVLQEDDKCVAGVSPHCERVKTKTEPAKANEFVEEEMQTSLVSMFSHRSIHGRMPKPNAWVANAAGKPITCDTAAHNAETIGTPIAKKIPPPHEEVAAVNHSLQHSGSGVVAAMTKKLEDKSAINKKKKPTTVRQRLARKLKIKF